MGIFDKIKDVFSGGGNDGKLVEVYVEDDKCGNQMKLIFRKSYDIQRVYEDDREASFEINKVVICDNCYNKINLHLEFDKSYNIINQEVEDGKLISEEEFENN